MLCACLIAPIFSGCGSKQAEADVEVVPATICVYSYTDEFTDRLEYVFNAHPDLRDKVERVTLTPEEYKNTIDTCLFTENEEQNKEEMTQESGEKPKPKYPDVFLADYSYISEYLDSEKILTLEEIGFSEDDLSQMYPFTTDSVKDAEGKVRAITWKLDPVAFVYRKSMASQYLGMEERKDVQSFVKDEHTLDDTLIAMKRKSGKDIRVLDSAYDYASDKAANTVFGFYADCDWLTKTLTTDKRLSAGDKWGVCDGPYVRDITSGEWLFVTKDCQNVELAHAVLKALCCEENILKNIQENESDFVNSKKVMSNAFHSGKGKLDVLGGEDYIEVYDK